MEIVKHLYPTAIPALRDIVIAEIVSIQDMAVYAKLPAYGGAEVMLPVTEINVRRHRKVSDYVRVGETVVVQVIRVAEDNKVDVSLKAVTEDEKKAAVDDYHRRLRVDQVLRTAANYDAAALRTLYETEVWPFEFHDVWTRFEEIRAEGTADTPLTQAVQQRFPVSVHTAEREVIIRFGKESAGVSRLSDELRRIAAMEGITVYVVAPPRYRIVATDKTLARAQERIEGVLSTLTPPS